MRTFGLSSLHPPPALQRPRCRSSDHQTHTPIRCRRRLISWYLWRCIFCLEIRKVVWQPVGKRKFGFLALVVGRSILGGRSTNARIHSTVLDWGIRSQWTTGKQSCPILRSSLSPWRRVHPPGRLRFHTIYSHGSLLDKSVCWCDMYCRHRLRGSLACSVGTLLPK